MTVYVLAKAGLRKIGFVRQNLALWHRFRRNLSVSLSGAAISVGIKALQTLLLTRALRVEDYGRVLIVINFFILLNAFFGLRVSDLMYRFFQRFKEEQNTHALQGLLLLCIGLSIITALVVVGGVFLFSPWVATHIYENPELTPLFRLYSWTILLTCLDDVMGPVLRIYDRFIALVGPQVLGSLTTVTILIAYLMSAQHYRLTAVLGAFAMGVAVQTVPPMLNAIGLLKPYLRHLNLRLAGHALRKHRRELLACLFNSNLSGYVKIAISPGDVFLLGVFSSTTQVALYGLAKQLTGPLALLQSSVQLSITPEITLLFAKRKFEELKRLVQSFTVMAFFTGALFVIGSAVVGRTLIIRFSKPEYVEALPLFYILLISAWGLLMVSTFRPLALSFDRLKWDNLTHFTTTVLVASAIVIGWFNGWTMALIQLVSVLLLRPLFSVPIWTQMRTAESLTPVK